MSEYENFKIVPFKVDNNGIQRYKVLGLSGKTLCDGNGYGYKSIYSAEKAAKYSTNDEFKAKVDDIKTQALLYWSENKEQHDYVNSVSYYTKSTPYENSEDIVFDKFKEKYPFANVPKSYFKYRLNVEHHRQILKQVEKEEYKPIKSLKTGFILIEDGEYDVFYPLKESNTKSNSAESPLFKQYYNENKVKDLYMKISKPENLSRKQIIRSIFELYLKTIESKSTRHQFNLCYNMFVERTKSIVF